MNRFTLVHRGLLPAILLILLGPSIQAATDLPPDVPGVKYGPHDRNVLDIWLPKNSPADGAPLMLFIHGGGWSNGDKSKVSPVTVQTMLDNDIAVASMNYRLTTTGEDKAIYPAQMHDAARAIQFLRANSMTWRLNPKRFATTGSSAGAVMSLWLAFHEDLADPKSNDHVIRESTRLLCAGASNVPTTLDRKTLMEWFNTKELLEHPALPRFWGASGIDEYQQPEIRKRIVDSSPITHLTADDPPVYIDFKLPDTPVDGTTPPGNWVHHPRLGIELGKEAKRLGVEFHIRYEGSPIDPKYPTQLDFLSAKLYGPIQ